MTSRSRPGFTLGFTLIELMVTMAIVAIAITAVTAVFLAQVRMYQGHTSRRAAQSSARQGLAFVEQKLRDSGYGVDPDRALIPFDSYDAANNAQGANFPDAIALHARDTLFSRKLTAASANSLSVTPALTEPLLTGQILLALCAGGRTYAYATVAATAAVGATTIALDTAAAPAESPVGPPGPRFHQQAQLTDQCFGDSSAMLTKVDRAAFYLAAFDDDRNAGTPEVPYLMLHRGVDLNGDGRIDANDSSPVAPGIEQLQLAFILNTIDATTPTIVGVASAPGYGDGWAASVAGPRWEDEYGAASRRTNHPANVRQVRVTLVARATRAEEAKAGDTARNGVSGPALGSGEIPWKDLENLAAPVGSPVFDPTGGGFARTVLRVSVAPKNLLMRAQFLPPAAAGG